MLMSPLNGVNKELTGRVSLCAARAGGVMAAVSVCNYTLSPCILAAVVGEQRLSRVQAAYRGEGGQKGGVRKSQHLLCFLRAPRTPPSARRPCWARLCREEGWLGLLWG